MAAFPVSLCRGGVFRFQGSNAAMSSRLGQPIRAVDAVPVARAPHDVASMPSHARAGAVGRTRIAEDLGFHDLRGTAVTMMSEAGCTPREIATITGHTLPSVTRILQVYTGAHGSARGARDRDARCPPQKRDVNVVSQRFCERSVGRGPHRRRQIEYTNKIRLVRPRGLEPPPLAGLAPQASASTNSAMAARHVGSGSRSRASGAADTRCAGRAQARGPRAGPSLESACPVWCPASRASAGSGFRFARRRRERASPKTRSRGALRRHPRRPEAARASS